MLERVEQEIVARAADAPMLDQVTAFYQEEAATATEAARSAQKRLGVLLTIITTGYVTIALTQGIMKSEFELVKQWFPDS